MKREEILKLIERNVQEILFVDLEVEPHQSLKDLGANSIDRADIIMQTLEELALKVPLVEFAGAGNIEGIISIIDGHLNKP